MYFLGQHTLHNKLFVCIQGVSYCTLYIAIDFNIVLYHGLYRDEGDVRELLPFSGPKKSRFSGPTPFNGPQNGFASIKIVKSRPMYKVGTLIVNILTIRDL
jgi:hypothetical protein